MIKRSGDWLSARVGDEIMMMSAQRGNYLGINEVGARVWELAEQPTELDAIVAQLVTEFEIAPDVCRREVEAFVAEMEQHGALARDPA